MSRIQRSVPPYNITGPSNVSPIQIASASCSSGLLDFAHALFAPLHYTPGYAYPLIVWLHGFGDDERQLQRIMPLVSMQNYVAVAPRGIHISAVESDCYGWPQAEVHVEQTEQRIFDSIELARIKFHIEPRRVFLVGFGEGGTMAIRLSTAHPDRFAGVVSICGAFPTGGKPFGNLAALRRLGILLATGRGSEKYPADQVCNDLRLLHTAGLSVTLREYPCGHELAPQMLADVNRWIMEQICPPPTSGLESDAEWSCEAE